MTPMKAEAAGPAGGEAEIRLHAEPRRLSQCDGDGAGSAAALLRSGTAELPLAVAAAPALWCDLVDPGTSIVIRPDPRDTYQDLLRAAAALRQAYLNPVPLLAARGFIGFAQLRDCIERLSGEAAVDQAVVVGGDPETARGSFAGPLDLLRTGLFERHGIRHVAIAGAGWEAGLASAEELGRAAGLKLSAVTPLCLVPETAARWSAGLRRGGIDLPIRLALPAPSSVAGLARAALRAGAELRPWLRRQGTVVRLMDEIDPMAMLRAVLAGQDPAAGISGINLVAFGAAAKALRWRRAAIESGRD